MRCPSDGAILPAGWDGLTITAGTADDQGVAKVEFYLGTEAAPFAVVTPSSGTPATFTATATAPPLPTGVGSGITQQYRVRAFDAANNHRDAFTTITVVETVDLDPVEGYNDWTALADQIAVLRSGTLSLSAPRTVGGLILLPGAKITHPASSPSLPRAAHLVVAGDAYVSCGALLDARGCGLGEAETYPGASPPGPSRAAPTSGTAVTPTGQPSTPARTRARPSAASPGRPRQAAAAAGTRTTRDSTGAE